MGDVGEILLLDISLIKFSKKDKEEEEFVEGEEIEEFRQFIDLNSDEVDFAQIYSRVC